MLTVDVFVAVYLIVLMVVMAIGATIAKIKTDKRERGEK